MLVATCRHLLPLGPPRLHFRPGQGLRDDRHHASPRHLTIGRQQHTWLVCLLPMGCTHQGINVHPNRITQILRTLQRKVESLKNQRYRGKFMASRSLRSDLVWKHYRVQKKSSGFFIIIPECFKNPFHEQVL